MTTTPPQHTCPITNQPLKTGQHISTQAATQIWTAYHQLAKLHQDAYNTITTPHTNHNPTTTPRKTTPTTPIPLNTLTKLDTATHTIHTWTQQLLTWQNPQTHLNPPTTTTRHTWAQHTQTILTQATTGQNTYTKWPQAPNAHHDLLNAANTLTRIAYPTRAPKHYAGPCPNCTTDIITPKTHGTTTCRCGQTINIQNQRHHMALTLQASTYPRNTARLAAQWITGKQIPQTTVRTWIHRHQLTEPTPGYIRVADLVHLTTTKRH